ncbi:MAG: hypothetical protein NTX03_08920 [Bacteroidetes bacterium]|nr:hypothetical protein [Bacteroidota bacterium]
MKRFRNDNSYLVLRQIIFCCSVLSILTNCEKPRPYIKLDKDFLSYCIFKKDSLWVYKDNKTGANDSVYVEYFGGTHVYGKRIGYDYDLLNFTLISTKYGGKTYQAMPWDRGSNDYYSKLDESPGYIRFALPLKVGDSTSDSKYPKIYLRKHLDSLSIQNKYYKDVLVVENSYDNKIKTEYFCKNVSLIKRVYQDSTDWELIKYQLK